MASNDMPISEQYRLVAKEYADLDGAASMLEEMKSAVLAQKMKALGDKPAAHAERDVKSSPEWEDYIRKMVDARTAANTKKFKLEYIRMRHSEWQSANANRRAEMKL